MPEATSADKQASPPKTVNVVNTPLPAGITEPVKEKPRTTDELADTVKPLAAAAPPVALTTDAPLTLNWKPAISTLLS